MTYLPSNQILFMGGSLCGGAGKVDQSRWLFDISSGDWTRLQHDANPGPGLGVYMFYDNQDEAAYAMRNGEVYNVDVTNGDLSTQGASQIYTVATAMAALTMSQGKQLYVWGRAVVLYSVIPLCECMILTLEQSTVSALSLSTVTVLGPILSKNLMPTSFGAVETSLYGRWRKSCHNNI